MSQNESKKKFKVLFFSSYNFYKINYHNLKTEIFTLQRFTNRRKMVIEETNLSNFVTYSTNFLKTKPIITLRICNQNGVVQIIAFWRKTTTATSGLPNLLEDFIWRIGLTTNVLPNYHYHWRLHRCRFNMVRQYLVWIF